MHFCKTFFDGGLVCKMEDKGRGWIEKAVSIENPDSLSANFFIDPELLLQLIKEKKLGEITLSTNDGMLKCETGSFTYLASLRVEI